MPGDLVHAYFKKKTAKHEDDVELVKSSKVDEGSVEEIDAGAQFTTCFTSTGVQTLTLY